MTEINRVVIYKSPSLDLIRTARFTLLGFCLVGPTLHFWYLYLSKLVTVPGASGAAMRLVLEQFVFAPMFIGAFFTGMTTLEGKPHQIIPKLQHETTKVSILIVGQQAIMDAYLCLLYLTAGILVESLFNAFATVAFFKFVAFSIVEMRYLLDIWKASRSANNGEGWESMRRELSVLHTCFYGILSGGILIMYELHKFVRTMLLLLHSFWIPQIITNVIRDSRKPLHPHYILGMTFTRLAIPLYILVVLITSCE